VDGAVPGGVLDALRQDAGYQVRRLAHQLGRGTLVAAAVGVGDHGAADLGQHVLGNEVPGHGTGAHGHFGEGARIHGGVHAHVAEHHDVVGIDVIRVGIRQHEHAGLARDAALGQQFHHGAEEGLGLVDGPAHHHVGVAQLHRPDAEEAGIGHAALGLLQALVATVAVPPLHGGGGEGRLQIRA